MSIRFPRTFSTFSTASWITVRLESPRKSILRRPILLTPFMSNWVTTPSLPDVERVRGTMLASGAAPITTPPPGGVLRGVAGDALEAARDVDDAASPGLALIEVVQVTRLGEGTVQGDPDGRRDQLGQPVDIGERDVEHPADITDGGPCGHRPEGDDLGHPVLTVLAGDVLENAVAAAMVEIG